MKNPAPRTAHIILPAAILALSTILLQSSTRAENPPATAPAPIPAESANYDIRDLIEHAMVQEPVPVQFGGPQMNPAALAQQLQNMQPMQQNNSRDEFVKQLMDTLKTTVAPDSWVDAGGPVGTIREFNGQLIIWQTPAVQAEIKKVIDTLRQRALLQILIEVRIYAVDQKTLDQLSENGPFLTAKQASPLLNPVAGEKIKLLAAPRALTFSGSRATQLTRISEQNYIESYVHTPGAPTDKGPPTPPFPADPTQNPAPTAPPAPPAPPGPESSADPIISTLTSGSVFRASGTVTGDNAGVIVHITQTTVNATLTPQKSPAASTTQPAFPTEKPATDNTGIEATFSVPTNMYALQGGDRIRPSPTEKDPDPDPTFIVYLVRATIVPVASAEKLTAPKP